MALKTPWISAATKAREVHIGYQCVNSRGAAAQCLTKFDRQHARGPTGFCPQQGGAEFARD